MSRLVVGLGFREQATAQSIGEVLAGIAARISISSVARVVAVPEDKAAHPGLLAAAQASHFSIATVGPDAMREAAARITTHSERVKDLRGVGSVCEAAALAIAGPHARLVITRIVSTDRRATAAAAMTEDSTP